MWRKNTRVWWQDVKEIQETKHQGQEDTLKWTYFLFLFADFNFPCLFCSWSPSGRGRRSLFPSARAKCKPVLLFGLNRWREVESIQLLALSLIRKFLKVPFHPFIIKSMFCYIHQHVCKHYLNRCGFVYIHTRVLTLVKSAWAEKTAMTRRFWK